MNGALALVGSHTEVPLVTGGAIKYVNLDYAASTPPLQRVRDAVDEFLPWYSSVHRGSGYKSQIASRAYDEARETVGRFFGARSDDAVIFTRNTTDAINLLASAVPSDAAIVMFPFEHHANMLPWRRGQGQRVVYAAPPSNYLGICDSVAAAINEARRLGNKQVVVAISAASNVTGEIWPIADIASTARAHSARTFVDAAQLGAHRAIDIRRLDVDYLAISGHKMYAPWGIGALIGRPDWLSQSEPFLAGGGAVELVTRDHVWWSGLPDRQEAGSPNVLGAIALAAACEALSEVGLKRIANDEERLHRRLQQRLADISSLQTYTIWAQDAPRVGIESFNLVNVKHAALAAALGCEYGVGVRHGCFCAHPLVMHLLQVRESDTRLQDSIIRHGDKTKVPGAVRISLGLGVTDQDIDYVADSIAEIVERGFKWTYVEDTDSGDFAPYPDPRPWRFGKTASTHHSSSEGTPLGRAS